MPQTIPHSRFQRWHLSPSKTVQFEHDHPMLPNVMVSIHTVHAQNMSNTLLAIKYHKTNKHYSLAYHSISHTPYNPYPASTRTCFMLQLHAHSNASSSFNTIDTVLCVHHTNLKFQSWNNSHIYHLRMPLFNLNVNIVSIHGRKLFSMTNLNYRCPILCTALLHIHFTQ